MQPPAAGGRPSFQTSEDALAWALTEIGAVLMGLPRERPAGVNMADVPILEAHRARRMIEILAVRVARACPNPAHFVDPEPWDVADAINEAKKQAEKEIPIQYRSEP